MAGQLADGIEAPFLRGDRISADDPFHPADGKQIPLIDIVTFQYILGVFKMQSTRQAESDLYDRERQLLPVLNGLRQFQNLMRIYMRTGEQNPDAERTAPVPFVPIIVQQQDSRYADQKYRDHRSVRFQSSVGTSVCVSADRIRSSFSLAEEIPEDRQRCDSVGSAQAWISSGVTKSLPCSRAYP